MAMRRPRQLHGDLAPPQAAAGCTFEFVLAPPPRGRPISGVARNNHSGLAAGVRWGMVTSAEVNMSAAGLALLTKEGRRLTLRVLEPAGAELKIYPTDPPPAATDAGNRGTRMLGFEVKVPAGASSRIAVLLVPGSTREAPAGLRPLDQW